MYNNIVLDKIKYNKNGNSTYSHSSFTLIYNNTPLVLNNLESIFMAMCVRCFPLGCQQWSGPPMIYSLAKSLF